MARRGLHAARIATSDRLRRVHDLLADYNEHSTLEIVATAQVCAVNSIIAELRANGAVIVCTQRRDPESGRRSWYYRMLAPAS